MGHQDGSTHIDPDKIRPASVEKIEWENVSHTHAHTCDRHLFSFWFWVDKYTWRWVYELSIKSPSSPDTKFASRMILPEFCQIFADSSARFLLEFCRYCARAKSGENDVIFVDFFMTKHERKLSRVGKLSFISPPPSVRTTSFGGIFHKRFPR